MEKCVKRVFITGGSGFLGRHILEAAKSASYEVLAPRSSKVDFETMDGVDEYFTRTIRNEGPIDVLVHSAAYYGGIGIIQAEPAEVFRRNCQMALNVFEVARRHRIKKVVAVGSACAYPGYLDGDLKERNFWDGKLHESVEAYGFTKKLMLVGQRAYYKQYGIESNHLALTNLYGPHDVFTEYRSHVLSALIKKFTDNRETVTLWGDGSPIREFLYVKDAAEAIVRSIPLDHDPEPINIGTGVGTSIRDLANLISQFTKYPGKIEWDTSRPNGALRKVLDVERMKQKLDWYPQFALADGLKETVDWYLPQKQQADRRE